MAQHNITRILAGAAIAATAMLAAGCTQDDTLAPGGAGTGALTPDAAQGIIISGSGTGSLGATRGYVGPSDATFGPQAEGVCRADAIDVLLFKNGKKRSSAWPTEDEMIFKKEEMFSLTDNDIKIYGNDRYAKFTHSIVNEADASAAARNYTYVLAYALAYTSADKSLFTTTLEGRNNGNATLTINDIGTKKTPELFYGILHGTGEVEQAIDSDPVTNRRPEFMDEGFFWNEDAPRDITFKGRIFRIVSQLNMNITDIPVSGVKRIELYGDNYPTEINLNGDHGTFYPVTAAAENQTTGQYNEADETDKGAWIGSSNYVLLDAKDIAEGDEEITLSSFLLPSTQGMRLKMRIEFSEDAVNLEDDDLIIKVEGEGQDAVTRYFKDYNIRPGQSYTIEDGADIYTTATQEQHYNNDQSSKDLYVYNNNEGKMCFYSYSNVRVTMSGKLEDIAGETGQSNIEIEVEPGFEKVHNIPLN